MKNKKLYDIQKACYYDSKEIILKILRSKKFKNAKELFNDLMNHLDKIPKDLADFVKNKLKPNFNSYMRHLEFDFLPTTNNKMENYLGVTLPRYLKKIFKTIEGITIYIDLQRVKWDYERSKIIPPMKIFKYPIFSEHMLLKGEVDKTPNFKIKTIRKCFDF